MQTASLGVARSHGILSAVLAGLAVVAVAGCTPAGLAVGAGTGAAVAASQERGFAGTLKDTQIRTTINYLWLNHSTKMYHQLGLSVYEGRVLLTGVVKSEEMRLDAVRLAWRAASVDEVINEIQVDGRGHSKNFVRDTWITARLKTKILFDRDVININYSVDTVNGTVYLFGVAQDRAELDRVTNHARNLKYVRKVVSHVLLKEDPRRTS